MNLATWPYCLILVITVVKYGVTAAFFQESDRRRLETTREAAWSGLCDGRFTPKVLAKSMVRSTPFCKYRGKIREIRDVCVSCKGADCDPEKRNLKIQKNPPALGRCEMQLSQSTGSQGRPGASGRFAPPSGNRGNDEPRTPCAIRALLLGIRSTAVGRCRHIGVGQGRTGRRVDPGDGQGCSRSGESTG